MKPITNNWLTERGLTEIRPGVYGRASMLDKALDQQSMPSVSLFGNATGTNKVPVGQLPAKTSKSVRTAKKTIKHVTGYIENEELLTELFKTVGPVDIYIPVQPISSKNSKEIGKIGSAKNGTQKTILMKSKAARNYDILAKPYLIINKLKFAAAIKNRPKPYYLYITFIMRSSIRFDFVNLCQGIFDLMQSEDIAMLEDDDFSNVIPVFNPDVYLSKSRAGMIIQVINGIKIY